jgi:hypothetical protein
MMTTGVYKMPVGVSLGVVAGILAAAIAASLLVTGRERRHVARDQKPRNRVPAPVSSRS